MSFIIDLVMVAVLVGLYAAIHLLVNFCQRQIQK